jgi:hypothetical protein
LQAAQKSSIESLDQLRCALITNDRCLSTWCMSTISLSLTRSEFSTIRLLCIIPGICSLAGKLWRSSSIPLLRFLWQHPHVYLPLLLRRALQHLLRLLEYYANWLIGITYAPSCLAPIFWQPLGPNYPASCLPTITAPLGCCFPRNTAGMMSRYRLKSPCGRSKLAAFETQCLLLLQEN